MQQEESMQRFEELWKSGPWRKLGKIDAAKRFKQTVKTEADWVNIQLARDEYASYCRQNQDWYKPQWGLTFMSKWRNWLFEKERPVTPKDFAAHDTAHLCDLCTEPHGWVCVDELCTLEKTAPCAGWMAAYRARNKRA